MNRTSGFVAFLALAAWANVQVMACCWFPAHSHSTPAAAITVQASSEHDCCHKASASVSVPVSVTPDGSGLITVAGHTCCNHDAAQALQSSAPSVDLTIAGVAQFLPAIEQPSLNFHRATVYRGSGPPVFLASQRLLI